MIRFPHGLKPIVKKYEQKIAKLAREVVRDVTAPGPDGPVDEPQWSFDVEPLGAGSWGVVWPLADERFILKVTADPTEGPVVATIMAEPYLHDHMAILHYFALREIPEFAVFRGKPFKVYVIVAERLVHSSQASKLLDADDDEQYDNLHRFTLALQKLQLAARALVHEREKKRPSAWEVDKLYGEWLDALNRLGDGPLEDFIIQFYDHTRSESEGADDAPSGGVLADLHFNNIGKRVVDWTDLGIELRPSHDNAYWVINDPGHSSLAEKPEVRVLENPPGGRRARARR